LLVVREDELGLRQFGCIVVDGLDGTEFGIGGHGLDLLESVGPALHAQAHATTHTAAQSEEGEETRCHDHHAAADEDADEEVPVQDKFLVNLLASGADVLEVITEALSLEQV